MVLTPTYCKAILDTLPIGYYLGKAVDVKMSLNAETSFCDMQSESIVISYPAIAKSLIPAPEVDDPEWQVRTHLYHEISHLLLTPKDLVIYAENTADRKSDFAPIRQYARDIMNIVEDERIETIMKHHFMNVDFEKSLEIENPSPKELMKDPDPMSRFFAAVRFHMCPNTNAMRAIQRLLEKFLYLRKSEYTPEAEIREYAAKAFNIFLKYFFQAGQQGQSQSEEPDQSDDGQQSDDKSNGKASGKMPPHPAPAMSAADNKKAERLKAEFEQAIEAAIKFLDVKRQVQGAASDLLTNHQVGEITTRMKKILQAAMNRRAMHAPSSSAYAGRIDPRLTANKDYRWFIKSNKGSDGNKFSKVKINLFVDCSGSFSSAMPKVNAILKAFREVKSQMPEFDYDVIGMECGEFKIPKSTLSLDAMGGNNLDDKIHQLYRDVQTPNARIANVVVFDGDAWSFGNREKSGKNASAFNHPNCVVVTNDANEGPFNQFAPQAKRIVVRRNYASIFTDKVFESLERLLA